MKLLMSTRHYVLSSCSDAATCKEIKLIWTAKRESKGLLCRNEGKTEVTRRLSGIMNYVFMYFNANLMHSL